MKVFFKIIIPIYNSEEYIEKCIMSVENQTFRDFMIIAINDMCTDDTFNKVKAMNYDNLIPVETNKKLYIGGARNVGIHYDINSEYTLFIDNDDWLHNKSCLQDIYDNIVNNNYPDCVRLPYGCLCGNDTQFVLLNDNNPKDLCNSLYIAPWTKCVKSNLVVDFPENTLIEDVVQHIEQVDNIETVSVLDKPVIIWNRNNANSASLVENQKTLLNGKRISSVYRNIADLMDLQCKHDYCEDHRLWRIKCYKNMVREGKEETF